MRHRDDGQVVLSLAVALMIVAGTMLVGVKVARAAVGKAEAQATADMAALAGAKGGSGVARSVVLANGGSLRSAVGGPDGFTVVVDQGPASATARAVAGS